MKKDIKLQVEGYDQPFEFSLRKLHFSNFIKKSFSNPHEALHELVMSSANDDTKKRIEQASEEHWGLELLLGTKLTESMGLEREVKKLSCSQT